MREGTKELLYQWLETEIGGVEVYRNAIECAINEDLKKEWEKYLEQTQRHVEIVTQSLTDIGMDPQQETPGRLVVRHIGNSLVEAMQMAKKNGSPESAQIVAAECVVHAETKDHMNWHLVMALAEEEKGDTKKVLQKAVEEVEDEEDEHLYHTKGWTRELWIESMGMPAVLPPPEEEKDVKTAIGAARAEKAREAMV